MGLLATFGGVNIVVLTQEAGDAAANGAATAPLTTGMLHAALAAMLRLVGPVGSDGCCDMVDPFGRATGSARGADPSTSAG
ncbi:hypothetical protein C1I64_18945 [Rathayibacter festucae DSM 15932]|uniref:Uncharacterized protein n=1 Tax=Rathayibacter festucae DSM 15932 TaxID=1328866 RepID=A0A3T0T5R1_9MICO|nr:hypothetical protein C1I64_18945 [Rathayibacter festucae DSM 15932]